MYTMDDSLPLSTVQREASVCITAQGYWLQIVVRKPYRRMSVSMYRPHRCPEPVSDMSEHVHGNGQDWR